MINEQQLREEFNNFWHTFEVYDKKNETWISDQKQITDWWLDKIRSLIPENKCEHILDKNHGYCQKCRMSVVSDFKISFAPPEAIYSKDNQGGFHSTESPEEILWCDRQGDSKGTKCKCVCHQTGYSLPKDFSKLESTEKCSNVSCFKGQIPDGTTARKPCNECSTPPLDSLDEEFATRFNKPHSSMAHIGNKKSEKCEECESNRKTNPKGYYKTFLSEQKCYWNDELYQDVLSFLHSVHDRAYEEGLMEGIKLGESTSFPAAEDKAYQTGVRETMEKIRDLELWLDDEYVAKLTSEQIKKLQYFSHEIPYPVYKVMSRHIITRKYSEVGQAFAHTSSKGHHIAINLSASTIKKED